MPSLLVVEDYSFFLLRTCSDGNRKTLFFYRDGEKITCFASSRRKVSNFYVKTISFWIQIHNQVRGHHLTPKRLKLLRQFEPFVKMY
jgi:hypothetical protein